MAVGIGCAPTTNTPTILISPFYNGPEGEGRKAFEEFFDVGAAMEMMETRPYVKQVHLISSKANLRMKFSSHSTFPASADTKSRAQ